LIYDIGAATFYKKKKISSRFSYILHGRLWEELMGFGWNRYPRYIFDKECNNDCNFSRRICVLKYPLQPLQNNFLINLKKQFN
jgi:hypothetical protein